MLSKGKIKLIGALRHKKYRQKYGKLIVEGVKVCCEILKEDLMSVVEIFATEQWLTANQLLLKKTDAEIHSVSEKDLAKISGFKTSQSVLMLCATPDFSIDLSVPGREWCLYLEAIRDPGNLGTLFRISDWFGMRTVYLSRDCVDRYNPKVIQASMTSVFRLNIIETALSSLVHDLYVPILGCDMAGKNLNEIALPEHGLIILGNESAGLSKEARLRASDFISIPGNRSLGADSLNVAVAGAIICARIAQ